MEYNGFVSRSFWTERGLTFDFHSDSFMNQELAFTQSTYGL